MFSEWKGLGRQERSVTYLLYNVEMVLLDQKYPQSGRKTSKIRLTSIKDHSHPQGHRGLDIFSWEFNKNDLIIQGEPINISSFSSDIFSTMTSAIHPLGSSPGHHQALASLSLSKLSRSAIKSSAPLGTCTQPQSPVLSLRQTGACGLS